MYKQKSTKIILKDNFGKIYKLKISLDDSEGVLKKESNVILVLDKNQNVITDKIYSGTKYWKDYEKIDLYTM